MRIYFPCYLFTERYLHTSKSRKWQEVCSCIKYQKLYYVAIIIEEKLVMVFLQSYLPASCSMYSSSLSEIYPVLSLSICLSLKLSCAELNIPVVFQAAGQVTVLMHQLTWLQVRLTQSWYCNSKSERSIQTSNLENSSNAMLSLEFSCCVCSRLLNWRSKGSPLEQKPFFSILCLPVCTGVHICAPLSESSPGFSRIPEPHSTGRWMPRKL